MEVTGRCENWTLMIISFETDRSGQTDSDQMTKKDNKQCLLDTPQTVMVNKENYYQEYKGHTKWLSLISSHFAKNTFFAWYFFMHMLIISILYVQSIRKLQ